MTHQPTTETYTLSLHDALPIYNAGSAGKCRTCTSPPPNALSWWPGEGNVDRKSTRLNSSHRCISYAVFCLKKKKPMPLRQLRPDLPANLDKELVRALQANPDARYSTALDFADALTATRDGGLFSKFKEKLK